MNAIRYELTVHLDVPDVSAFLRLNIRPLLRVGVLETVKKDLPYADRTQQFRTAEK
jgi:hypothetical protein